MGKAISVKINRWDGGVVNSARSKRSNVAKIITNAEILKDPNKITPYRSTEDGNTNAAADFMQAWCVANLSGTYKLYGLARTDAADKVRILYKHLLTDGATPDLSTNTWTETANNLSSTQTTVSYNCFVYYPKLNMIFGGHAGRYIWEYDPDGGTAFNETDADLTAFTFIGQGLVHPKDDILYIPYYNAAGYIASNNNGTWNTTALTLPANMKPVSICELGNFLAIGCADTSGYGNSKVYIWDRNSSLATLSENYDLPDGTLSVLENINGTLVAIMQTSGTSTSGQAVISTIRAKDNILFQELTPEGFKTFLTLEGTTGTQLPVAKQKRNGRLYFQMSINLHSARREGVWSVGKNELGQWTLIHEYTPDNDTLTENSGTGALRGFFVLGDYVFQAFVNAASGHEVTKTDNASTYSATTIYESVVNPNMPEEDLYKNKTPTSVTVRYVALPTAGQVVLKQRADSTTAWASITAAFTDTTDSSKVQEITSNTNLTSGRELEFRLESTGGAEILELIYSYEVNETNAK